MASALPNKTSRLYPPHYASIQAIEALGDEELGTDLILVEINEELFAGYGGEEDEDPPIMSEEHLQLLDSEARKSEVERMLGIPAMVEATREEVEECSGYIISTKFVQTWKHRVEKGGWFRRAHLVGWEFKTSVDIEQTFAPTSIMVLPKMLIHMMLNILKDFVAMTLGVKDAFLMASQPEDKGFCGGLPIGEMPPWSEDSSVPMVPTLCIHSKVTWRGPGPDAADPIDEGEGDIHRST